MLTIEQTKTGNIVQFTNETVKWKITKVLGMGRVNLKMISNHKFVKLSANVDDLVMIGIDIKIAKVLQRISRKNTSASKYMMRPLIDLNGVNHK